MIIATIKDQNDNIVPSDLVIIPNSEAFSWLTDDEIKLIDESPWYDVKGVILVSASKIHYLSEDNPLDAGIDIYKDEIWYVDHCLHRFNEEDGFFHA